MKKIAIITITDYTNLGNRLQNYATQEILKKYGLVETFKRFDKSEDLSIIGLQIRRIKYWVKMIAKKLLRYSNISIKGTIKRSNNFKSFTKGIKEGITISKHTNLKRIEKKYDVFVTGSDQIWNPNFFSSMYINMLAFTSNKKKLALAPSIAVNNLTLNQYNEFKSKLKDFDYLSCREQQGADLITKITGKKCESLIDPTLMLSKEKWDMVSKKPIFHNDNKRYILLYFLGNLIQEYKNIISLIKEKYNLEVINIYDKESIYYSCGPSEFIYLVKNCELMLTDSFHGSVFSYIYDRPLRIFKRIDSIASMNSRLSNLINKLHLNDDIYFDSNIDIENILNVNYDKSYLLKEQEKFNNYLRSYFDSLEEKNE